SSFGGAQWCKSAIPGEFWPHLSRVSSFFPPPVVPLGRFFVRASSSSGFLLFLLAEHGAQTLNIACHDGEGHVALETIHAMIGAFVQPMNAQRIDRRFNR